MLHTHTTILHIVCTRKDGKKPFFSDIALGGLSGELSWMLFFFLAKTKTTTREPFFSPLKLAFVPAFFCLFPLLLLRGSFYPWLNSFTNCKNRSSTSTCCSSQHLVCNCISMYCTVWFEKNNTHFVKLEILITKKMQWLVSAAKYHDVWVCIYQTLR